MLISIWDSTYFIVLVQIAWWTILWIRFFCLLNNNGLRTWIIYSLAVVLGINSANLFYVVTIWKDIPYTLCLIWITLILIEVYNGRHDWNVAIGLFGSLSGICLFRYNGIVPYIMTILGLMYIFVKRKSEAYKYLIAIICSILFVTVLNGPVKKAVGVEDDASQKGVMYVGLSQELFAAYKYGQVSDETKHILQGLAHGNIDDYAYNPYWANAAYDLDVPVSEFVKCYIDSFIHNPGIMIKAMLVQHDLMWNIWPGEESFVNLINYYGGWDGTDEWRQYYPERCWTTFGRYIEGIVSYAGNNTALTIVFWRNGLHVALLVLVLVTITILNKQVLSGTLVMCIPMLGQIVSLLLSTGWADYRYYWIINLLSLLLVTFFFNSGYSNEVKGNFQNDRKNHT